MVASTLPGGSGPLSVSRQAGMTDTASSAVGQVSKPRKLVDEQLDRRARHCPGQRAQCGYTTGARDKGRAARGWGR